MPDKYIAFVCSETHWDREWYGTFQQYRWRLVRLMDKLLELLDSDSGYRCFNLDGQTVCLEDYLDIRPEQRPVLERLVREDKLVVGPWYILPDEFCVSGEATIRNLLRGHQVAHSFGRRSSAGYLPDMFGHISQMPQILQGVGIDNAMLWRGLSGDEYQNELWWEAPDGSRVLLEHIPEYSGYCNAALFAGSLPPTIRGNYPDGHYLLYDNPEEGAEALGEVVEWAARRATGNVLLLLNGIDHMEPQPGLPEVLRLANERYEHVEFRHATFDEFVAALREATPDELQVVRGELKDTVWSTYGGGICLPNILSSRAYMKLKNEECQYALERVAEPLCAMATMVGAAYPAAQLRKAWQWLLKNHPHDSIGGCSTDRVHSQMMTRFEWSEEIAGEASQQAMFDLASQLDTSALSDDEAAIMIFNTLNWDVTDRLEIEVDLAADWLARQGLPTDPLGVQRDFRQVRLTDWEGREIPCRLADARALTVMQSYRPGFAPHVPVVRATLSLWAEDLPALGYRAYRLSVRRKKQLVPSAGLVTGPNVMENEFLRVAINPNGTLDLTDKATGAVYHACHYFEDGGDNGDGYTYSPPIHDAVLTTLSESPRLALVADGPEAAVFEVQYGWPVPAAVTADRQRRAQDSVELPIVSRITLGLHSRRVDIETTVHNTARDHRLRVVFPTGAVAESCVAEGHFDVLERPIHIEQPPVDVWREDQPRQYPQQGWCAVGDEDRGLAVASQGLLEFEAIERPERPLAVTLLRATNFLGAAGYPNTIQGGAGPHMETPEAQCLRTMTFRYAILPFAGSWLDAGVQQQAYQHNARPSAFHAPGGGTLSPQRSFLRVDGRHLVVSAVKQSEDGEALVARFWNSSSHEVEACVSAPGLRSVQPADLLERPIGEPLTATDEAVRLAVGGHKIGTLRLMCERA